MSSNGLVVWLTGLPSSGKSTLARATASALRDAGRAVLVLDGDEVRSAIATRPRYDDEGRDAFYETLARLAALAADQGLVVLVPATAHLRRHRARARELAPRFLEVFVDTPLGECERRDAKGLYARARLDPQSTLPGVGVPYEPPEAPEMVARPGEADAVHRMIALMSPR